MWYSPNAPAIGRAAFDEGQVKALRQVLDEAVPYMCKTGHYANSISYPRLISAGRPDLFKKAFQVFIESNAHEFGASVFPDGYCFLLEYCALRRHDPDVLGSHLQIHFDANFLGTTAPVYNVWVTLDDVGDGAPGLSFLDPRLDIGLLRDAWYREQKQAVAERGDQAGLSLMYDADGVAEVFGKPIEQVLFSPRVKAGDFIAFHQCVAHATELVVGPARRRRSIEFRIASVTALPKRLRSPDSQLGVCRTAADGSRSIEFVGAGKFT